jgi:biopolymer transport protein ExbB
MFSNIKQSALRICAILICTAALNATAQTANATQSAAAVASAAVATVVAVPTTAQEQPKVAKPTDTEHGENPYGIKALWEQGDMVARSTLLILIVMSMASWYVIFTKYFEQSKVNRYGKSINEKFWAATSLKEAVATLNVQSPYRFIADKGLESAGKHTGLMGGVDFNTWVTMGIQRAMTNVQSRMQDGLAVLATVGSTAPFVGLFGTVWGIYNALVKIGISGQASIDKVAGPVGESLIMTAIGLAVAVPAVLGYNWLVRRNKSVMEEVHAFGNDLHSVLLASGKQS